ncbi:hypothetical protein PVAND_014195 [Polypedilum vanderplanki]|uniref:Uncharacterized protein n=1 Tax=Polypedilum vanderplanki TaxID=319348 RepID=A0A9J6CSQ4_POLVA|nr:hypothetical protein PVAND_014195 [Polypedilum vanderplanki]
MENIREITKGNYNPAEHSSVQVSVWTTFSILFGATLITIKVFFINLLKLFERKIPKDIINKVVLVTGGGNGLGRALSMRFAKEGCKIAIADIDYKNAQKTAEEIKEKYKVDCKAFECDITNYSAILKLKIDIENSLGPVDILVNNAGYLYSSLFLSSGAETIEKVIELNLTSQIKMTRTFLPTMIDRKYGHIISIASIGSLSTVLGGAVYNASKWGLNGFMSNLYDEIHITKQDEFIKLTTIYPQYIDTRKELSDILDKAEFNLPRSTPEHVANKVVEGMLMNETKIIVSTTFITQFEIILTLMRFLPDETRKYIYGSLMNLKKFHEVLKNF